LICRNDTKRFAAERLRIHKEYRRREREISTDLYAPWDPAEIFMQAGRRRIAAILLHRMGVFPGPNDCCLEIGFGNHGWLVDLLSWGITPDRLYGIELNPERVARAKSLFPNADLQLGDAVQMPWPDETFQLVVASTVLSSVLCQDARGRIAEEVTRVLRPGGALLWYDLAINNPRNPNIRKVDRRELGILFPRLSGEIRSVTLAPPLLRLIVHRSFLAASILESIPFLRTHILAVLIKAV
jgi:ubiquinone/menaquinone biosynthesis C-methylase UbiE